MKLLTGCNDSLLWLENQLITICKQLKLKESNGGEVPAKLNDERGAPLSGTGAPRLLLYATLNFSSNL